MAGGSLLALFDGIASVLDDVAAGGLVLLESDSGSSFIGEERLKARFYCIALLLAVATLAAVPAPSRFIP